MLSRFAPEQESRHGQPSVIVDVSVKEIMSAKLNLPNLKNIGGSLNVTGSQETSEKNFPSLESVGGDMHLALSGFVRLPTNLKLVEGNIYLSSEMPKTLKDDCLAKKAAGVVKGDVYLVGGKITIGEDGNVIYEEMLPLESLKIKR
jgi:hypothetical protein